MNFLKELWEAVIYFLFPSRCPVCREIVDERYQLCETCAEKILRLDFSKESPPAPIKRVLRVTKYRDGLQPLLHKLKFDNNLNVLPALKKILGDAADNVEMLKLLEGIDFAVPVPLHEERLKERGFNQTEEIFEDFLAKKNIPLRKILIRRVATPKLYKFGKEDRQKILKGAFAAIELVNLRGKKILVVDDIFTTGTTVSECAKVLKEMGAETISVLALASDFGEFKK
jgi:ComF family protein